jgi:hypothetical protein
MVDDGKEEKHPADTKAPPDQPLFDRQQRLGLYLAKFFADARRDFDIVGAPRRRFIPGRGSYGHMYSPLPVNVRDNANRN